MRSTQNTVVVRTLSNPIIAMKDSQFLNIQKIYPETLDNLLDRDDTPRKRRRLTHLSTEEKLLRRKLKNRVAAQSARDRKKALMSDFEDRIVELEETNQALMTENANLRVQSDLVLEENKELRHRLGMPVVDLSCVKAESECMVSAEGTHSGRVSHDSDLCGLAAYDDESDYLFNLLRDLEESDEAQSDNADNTGCAEGDKSEVAYKMVGTTPMQLDTREDIVTAVRVRSSSVVKVDAPNTESKPAPLEKSPYRMVLKLQKQPASKCYYKTLKLIGSVQNAEATKVKCVPLAGGRQQQKGVSLLKSNYVNNNAFAVMSSVDDVCTAVDVEKDKAPMVLDFGSQINLDGMTDVGDIVGEDFMSQFVDSGLDSVGGCDISQNSYVYNDTVDVTDNIASLVNSSEVDTKPTEIIDVINDTKQLSTSCRRKRKRSDVRRVMAPMTFATVPSVTLSPIPSPMYDPYSCSLSDSGYSGSESPAGSDLSATYDDEVWQETLTELFPSLL